MATKLDFFQFLGDVYEFLPPKMRNTFLQLWDAMVEKYQTVTYDLYATDIANYIHDCPVYDREAWFGVDTSTRETLTETISLHLKTLKTAPIAYRGPQPVTCTRVTRHEIPIASAQKVRNGLVRLSFIANDVDFIDIGDEVSIRLGTGGVDAFANWSTTLDPSNDIVDPNNIPWVVVGKNTLNAIKTVDIQHASKAGLSGGAQYSLVYGNAIFTTVDVERFPLDSYATLVPEAAGTWRNARTAPVRKVAFDRVITNNWLAQDEAAAYSLVLDYGIRLTRTVNRVLTATNGKPIYRLTPGTDTIPYIPKGNQFTGPGIFAVFAGCGEGNDGFFACQPINDGYDLLVENENFTEQLSITGRVRGYLSREVRESVIVETGADRRVEKGDFLLTSGKVSSLAAVNSNGRYDLEGEADEIPWGETASVYFVRRGIDPTSIQVSLYIPATDIDGTSSTVLLQEGSDYSIHDLWITLNAGASGIVEITYEYQDDATGAWGFPYSYELTDDVVEMATLQTSILASGEVLTFGTDYTLAKGYACLTTLPTVDWLWSPSVRTDKQRLYRNFGFLIGFSGLQRYVTTITSSEGYRRALLAAWRALYSGPSIHELRTALHALLGLPVTTAVSTVKEITATTITITENAGTDFAEDFVLPYPAVLTATCYVSQVLAAGEVLTTGVNIYDKTIEPGFIRNRCDPLSVREALTQFATLGTGDTDEEKAKDTLEANTWLLEIESGILDTNPVGRGYIKSFLEKITPPWVSTILYVLTDGGDLHEDEALAVDRAYLETDYTATGYGSDEGGFGVVLFGDETFEVPGGNGHIEYVLDPFDVTQARLYDPISGNYLFITLGVSVGDAVYFMEDFSPNYNGGLPYYVIAPITDDVLILSDTVGGPETVLVAEDNALIKIELSVYDKIL